MALRVSSPPCQATAVAANEFLRHGEPSFEILKYSYSASIPFNMEDALAPPSLAPSPAPLAAAVLTRRRSHHDSASYCTLSHLFSHCFHLYPSCGECSAPSEAELAAANPTGVDSGDSPQKGPPTAAWSYWLTDANATAYAYSPSHIYDSPAQEPCLLSLSSSQSLMTYLVLRPKLSTQSMCA
jgi:hypothetical protein